MTTYLMRAAITLIGGALVISQILLAIASIMKPDVFWTALATMNTIMLAMMMVDLWDRAGR